MIDKQVVFEGHELNTVEILHQATEMARIMGYEIREEWLGGTGGGGCEFGGKKWIFLDVADNPMEQLESVADILCQDPAIHLIELPAPLRKLWGIGKVG
tara:strand:- start:172 stop:468 length:297 start_codon:yes stop_codon:yes gene_type:complete